MNNFIQDLSFGEVSIILCTLLGIAFILIYFYLLRDKDKITVYKYNGIDPSEVYQKIKDENEIRKAALAENIVKMNDIEDLKSQIKRLEERILQKEESFVKTVDRMLSVANERQKKLLLADQVVERYEKINKDLLEIIEEHLGL